MISAVQLLNVERGQLSRVAEALVALEGVSDVYSVAGDWDLVALLRVKHHEDLNDLVTGKIGAVEGITRTNTLIAFRAYSSHDPGLAWDIGGDTKLKGEK